MTLDEISPAMPSRVVTTGSWKHRPNASISDVTRFR